MFNSPMRKKCTAISYNCGAICLSLHKTCRIGNAAIGKDRLNKIKALAQNLASGGADTRKGIGKPGQTALERLGEIIQTQRNAKAAMIKKDRSKQVVNDTELVALKDADKELREILETGKESDGTSIDEQTALRLTRHLERINDRIKQLGGEVKEPIPRFKAIRSELTGSEKQVNWATTIRDTAYQGAKFELSRLQKIGVEGITDLNDEDFRVMQGHVIDLVNKQTSASYWIDNRNSNLGQKIARQAVRNYAEDMISWGDRRINEATKNSLIQRRKAEDLAAAAQAKLVEGYAKLKRHELSASSEKQRDYANKKREWWLNWAMKNGVSPEDAREAMETIPALKTAKWWLDYGNLKHVVAKMKEPAKIT